MFVLDLFNTDHERRIAEGAVDQLEQRRIDDLAMKMDDLVARAKTPAYKKNPAALAALMKEFQKCKAERDSYYMVRNETMGYGSLGEAGIPGNVPTEKIPGKEDLLKGKGRSYYEGTEENDDWYDANGRPNPRGAYDVSGNYYADREDQDAGYDAYKERNLTSEATGDSKFDAMMSRISRDPWTQLNSDPNWEYEIEELVDQQIEPWLLAMEKSGMPITQDNETLNPGWRKRYEQVANKLAQEFLTSRGLNPRDPDLLGKIRFAIDSHTDQSRNVAGQLSAYSELPLARYADAFDADGQTANMRDAMVGFIRTDDDDDDEPPTRPMPDNDPRRLDPGNMEEGNFVVANKPESPEEKEKRDADGQARTTEIAQDHARAQKRDILQSYAKLGRMRTEAIWAMENDVYMNKDQILDYIEKKSHDPSLSALEYMHDLGHDVDGLFKNVTRFLTGAGISPAKIQAVQNKITRRMGEINERRLAEDAVDSKTWMKQTRVKYPTAKFMQAKMPGAPIRAYVNGKVVAEFDTDQKKNSNPVDEHGGGIGPRQHWQDLMQENKLAAGDPVIVTAPNEFEGKTGEIYELSPSGKFVIVDLYNHGKHSMHLSDVEFNQYADDQDEEDDWYDQGVAEGWSDAVVARRTGGSRTPYSVYIKGRKWKDFENDDHAEAVANKLRAKFKADGRDPGVITVAPTDYDKKSVNELDATTLKSYADKRGAQVAAMKADNPDAPAGSPEWIKQAVPAQQVNLAKRKIARKERQQGVAETALNTKDPQGDYAAKRKALQDLGMNKEVDQQAVLQRRLDLDREAKASGINEGAMGSLHADLADVYNRMAPGIERNRDSFKAGQLYDALEAVAEQHGAEAEFKRMMNGARNRAHMDYDTNPGGFQNWFWYLPFAEEKLSEEQDTSAVERAILNRIMVAHTDLLMKFGPEKVMQAAEEVAYNVGDVDEIGTSDVSAYVHQVKQILGVPEELDEKWSQKYKSSINCANPKGFSQKAHCAGKKK
jgi:hypothetical protein